MKAEFMTMPAASLCAAYELGFGKDEKIKGDHIFQRNLFFY